MTCRGNAPAAVADPASGVSLDVQVSVDGGTHYTPVDSAQHTVAVPCLSPTPMLPPSPPTDPPSPPSAPLSPANPPHTPAPSNPPQPPYFPMVPVPGWGKTMPGCNLGNMPSICLETTLGSSTAALRCCHSDGSCLGSICDESTRPVTGTDPDGLNVAMPDAIRECSAQGGRLCNSTEIDTCCNSGCSMDSATKLWVSDLDCAPPPMPPILPPPPPRHPPSPPFPPRPPPPHSVHLLCRRNCRIHHLRRLHQHHLLSLLPVHLLQCFPAA